MRQNGEQIDHGIDQGYAGAQSFPTEDDSSMPGGVAPVAPGAVQRHLGL